MPFTVSHMVVAPPLAKLVGQRIPMGAFAIGAMAPDLYRLFTTETYNLSHQWQGLYTINLAIGLFFCCLWYLLYRPVLFRFLNITDPLGIRSFRQACGFTLMLCLGIMIGTATHLIWDGLTHLDFRTFAFSDFLGQAVTFSNRTYPMHRVLQIGSSIVALPLVIWMVFHYYCKHKQPLKLNKNTKYFAISLMLISLLSGYFAYLDYAQGLNIAFADLDLYAYFSRSINQFATATLISFSLGCLVFLILDYCGLFDGIESFIS